MCKKKQLTHGQAKGILHKLKDKGGYAKYPWRDEVAFYRCDECKAFHLSSVMEKESNTLFKDISYFDFQKDKWRNFLQNYSHKRAKI